MSAILRQHAGRARAQERGGPGVDRGAAAGRHVHRGSAREGRGAGDRLRGARLAGARRRAGTRAPASSTGAPVALSFDEALRRALAANLRPRPRAGRGRRSPTRSGAARCRWCCRASARAAADVRNDREVAFGGEDFSRVILPRNDWNTAAHAQPADLRRPARAARLPAGEGERARGRAGRAHHRGPHPAAHRGRLPRAWSAARSWSRWPSRRWRWPGPAEAGARLLRGRRDDPRRRAARRVGRSRPPSARLTLAQARRATPPPASCGIDLNLDGDVRGDRARARAARPRPDEALLLQRAQETRADVAQARSALRIAELEVSKQKGAYLPTITADAGYVWQKTAFPVGQVRLRRAALQRADLAVGRGRRARGGRQRARDGRPDSRSRRRCAARRRTCAARCSTSAPRRPRSRCRRSSCRPPRPSTRRSRDLYRSQEATSLDIAVLRGQPRRRPPRASVVSRIGKLVAELGVHFAAGDLKSAVLKEAQP